jgi:hypothetical protein
MIPLTSVSRSSAPNRCLPAHPFGLTAIRRQGAAAPCRGALG